METLYKAVALLPDSGTHGKVTSVSCTQQCGPKEHISPCIAVEYTNPGGSVTHIFRD